MNNKPESTSRNITRSLSMGVLLSMLFFYAIHVFGKWNVENYRPDPETTSTVLLHNTCMFFEKQHTLRPNTDISTLNEGVDGTKMAASFMNFFDGHIAAMIIIAVLLGAVIAWLRSRRKKNIPAMFLCAGFALVSWTNKYHHPLTKNEKAITGNTAAYALKNLVPLAIVNAKSNDVFKKYGIEFNGNCYACDLAVLQVEEKTVKLVNICDNNISTSFDIISTSIKGNNIEISCRNRKFILTKIDKAPVYQLSTPAIPGKENLRLAKFYTPKELLLKFKQHDCGDFEG